MPRSMDSNRDLEDLVVLTALTAMAAAAAAATLVAAAASARSRFSVLAHDCLGSGPRKCGVGNYKRMLPNDVQPPLAAASVSWRTTVRGADPLLSIHRLRPRALEGGRVVVAQVAVESKV